MNDLVSVSERDPTDDLKYPLTETLYSDYTSPRVVLSTNLVDQLAVTKAYSNDSYYSPVLIRGFYREPVDPVKNAFLPHLRF